MLLGLLIITSGLSAQDTAVKTLNEATIFRKKSKYDAFGIHQKIDSFTFLKYGNSSLNELLQQELNVSNQQYGLTLSQISFRGMSSNNTLIYAGGIPLTFSSLGTTDLSLIPVNLFNDATINQGGSGTNFSSGGNGGTINLGSSEINDKQVLLSGNIGSFGAYQYLLKVPIVLKNNAFRVSIYRSFATNHYSYYNDHQAQKSLEILDNSFRNSNGILFESSHKISKFWKINQMIWGVYAKSGIPTPIILPEKFESKIDSSLRLSTRINYTSSKIKFLNTVAYSSEGQIYFNPSIALRSKILCQKIFLNSELNYQFNKKLDFTISSQAIYTKGISNNYEGSKYFNQGSLYGRINYDFDSTLNANLFSRAEIFNGKIVTPSYGFLFSKKLFHNKYEILFNGNRNYLLPTLNDLYWYPGGNLNLKQEIDYQLNLDQNFQYFLNTNDIVKINLSAFYYDIKDKIVWLNNGSFYSPQNIGKVFSYGFQSAIAYTKIIGKICAQVKVKYQYNPVLNKTNASEIEFNKQLMYMPIHNLTSSLDIYGDAFQVGVNFLYNSQRFYTTDNIKALKSFYIFNLNGSYSWKFKSHSLSLNGKIKNLLSHQYEQVLFYPMPMRSFELGLTIGL